MKKIILFLIGFLGFLNLYAQAPLIPSVRCSLTTVTVFTDPYTVTGKTSDFSSNWQASDIAAGDSLYLLDGSELRIYRVVSISSASGVDFTIVIDDINNSGNVPVTGEYGALFRGTTNYDFPNVTSGISETLQMAIQNRFVQRLDALLKGFGTDYITTDSFTTYTNGATFASIPINKTVWRTTTGSKWEKTGASTMTRRSTDNGHDALLGFTQAGSTLLFNSRLYNRVKLNTGNISAATISNPNYYSLQDADEIFMIGVTSGSSDVVLTWGDVYGVFNNTTYDAMPTITVPAQSTMYFCFRVVYPSAESVKFRYVDGGAGGGGGNTNLTYTSASNQGTVNSDTGTDAVIPLASGTNAGLQSSLNNLVSSAPATIDSIMYFAKATNTWVRTTVGNIANTTTLNLDQAYNNFGATASKITVDAAQGQTGGLEFETSGTNPVTIDLSNGTGDFFIQSLDGASPVYHTFRENGQAVIGYGNATGDITPFATTILPRLQIGSNTTNSAYVMLAGSNNSGYVMQNVGTANINAQFASYSSRGAFTSPAFLSDNDPLMQISSYGWGGGANTTFVKGAGLQWYAQGTHSFTNRSQKIRVWTLTNGTSTPVDRFEFADRNIALVAMQLNAAKYETGLSTVTTTGTYAVLATDNYIRVDMTTGVQTYTLPSGATENGRKLKLKRIDNNPATVLTLTGVVDGVTNPTSTGGGSPIAALATQYGTVELRYNSTTSAWEVW